MGDYNSNYRGGDRRGGYRGRNSGGGGFGRRDEGPRIMHKAICAQCGKECEVPFRPSGDRPVYCSDCFEKRSNEGGNFQESNDRNFRRPQFQDRPTHNRPPPPQQSGEMMEQMRSLNAKLDRILRVLEPQTAKENKPVEVDMIESIVAAPEITEQSIVQPKAKKAKTTKKKAATLPL